MRLARVLLSLSLIACTAPIEGEDQRQTQNAIVGGTPSSASRDATVLLSENGRGICSGTLITPNLVLTARHCVTELSDTECGNPFRGDIPAAVFTVSTGVTASSRSVAARGAKLYTPPETKNGVCGADIALLLLDKDITNITPAVVRLTAPSADETGTAVGYGTSGGRKERSDIRILSIGPARTTYDSRNGERYYIQLLSNEFITGESTCIGDSGGPMLDGEGRIIAVASRGLDVDNTCVDRPTFWTPTSANADLIRSAATAAGHPLDENPGSTPNKSVVGGPASTSSSSSGGSTSGGSKNSSDKDDDREPSGSVASMGCAFTTPSRSSHVPLLTLTVVALGAILGRRRRHEI